MKYLVTMEVRGIITIPILADNADEAEARACNDVDVIIQDDFIETNRNVILVQEENG